MKPLSTIYSSRTDTLSRNLRAQINQSRIYTYNHPAGRPARSPRLQLKLKLRRARGITRAAEKYGYSFALEEATNPLSLSFSSLSLSIVEHACMQNQRIVKQPLS